MKSKDTMRQIAHDVRSHVWHIVLAGVVLYAGSRALDATDAGEIRYSHAPVEFFGVVLDQTGSPVEGALVAYAVSRDTMLDSLNRFTGDTRFAKTRDDGTIAVTGQGGYLFIREIRKPGYIFARHTEIYPYEASQHSRNVRLHEPDPESPVVFRGWKKSEPAEKLNRANDEFWTYKADGVFYRIPMEELEVELKVRFQLLDEDAGRHKRKWQATLLLETGGLIETDDQLMYEAPPHGYASEWTIIGTEHEHIERKFYFKAKEGQAYGHINLTLRGYYGDRAATRNKGAVRYSYVLNPAGSRNLLSPED